MLGLIFDIDGTLVDSYDFDTKCYKQAVTEILGDVTFRLDWGHYEHVTDEGILKQICADNLLKFDNSASVRGRFGQLVSEHLSINPTSSVAVPGARALIESLRDSQEYRIGLATGGWQNTAHLKLNHAGIRHEGLTCVSSDSSHDRKQIMELCRTRMDCSVDEVIYIGDGKWDMEATLALGWRFIGVGPRLKNQCPTWILDFESCDFESLVRAKAQE